MRSYIDSNIRSTVVFVLSYFSTLINLYVSDSLSSTQIFPRELILFDMKWYVKQGLDSI